MARSIAVTFDYRCPFAYNGNAAVIAALRAGSDVDFRFTPFSLDQIHVEEGAPPMWERDPSEWGSGVLSLLYGIAVRDTFPERFFDAHLALFAARHDHGLQLKDEDVLRAAVTEAGLDADAVAEEAHSGRPLKTLATEHTGGATDPAAINSGYHLAYVIGAGALAVAVVISMVVLRTPREASAPNAVPVHAG